MINDDAARVALARPLDAAFIEGVMATMKLRDAAGIKTRFAPYWEAAVHGFQAQVLDAIR